MVNKLTSNWNYPNRIWFGIDRIDDLPAACDEFSITKPLIVTDPYLAELPLMNNVQTILTNANFSPNLFIDIKRNPVENNIIAGIETFKQGNYDGIIAIGGGSALDSAKTVALLAQQTGKLWDYEDIDDNYRKIVPEKIIPLIAIPTTSGTGSEVGRAALIIDEQQHKKRFIFHPEMAPNLVIADPNLTKSLPPFLTATTGMDALAHNLEAYCAPGFHPMADGIALEGLRLIHENLLTAYQDGNNLIARAHLMAASIMGGTAFQKGLGAVHSLSHPIGAIYDQHHGLLNAIFMPYVLKYNAPTIEEKMIRLANYLELDNKSTEGVITWLIKLSQAMNIPTTLKELELNNDKLALITAQAMLDPSTASNPRPLNEKDFTLIFNNAFTGNL